MPTVARQSGPAQGAPGDAGGCAARLVYRRESKLYHFGPDHPLRQERLSATLDLLTAAGLSPTASELVRAPAATVQELKRVHSAEYIDAVQSLELITVGRALSLLTGITQTLDPDLDVLEIVARYA
jgi:acetoin utilization deacetylase AcuC-like enzyme